MVNPKNANSVYNYACALSLSNENDLSFKYLRESIMLEVRLTPLTDPDFLNLRDDKRWESFENELINLFEEKYKTKISDKNYAKVLWKMNAIDQKHYNEIYLVERKIGKNSTVANTLWEIKRELNEQNLKELEILIEKKGFPKISMVGKLAAQAVFLVIQHSNLELQKKYIPVIKKLCEIKEVDTQSYAYIYDRIQVRESKPQKYGTQIKFNKETSEFELFPLENKEKVDQWRREIGLGLLNDYLKGYGIKL